jgi:putative transcriptional regulator
MKKSAYLDGQLLIAMPGMSDPRFDRSVVYMCAHSESGAMGLIINKAMPMMSFGELVAQLDIAPDLKREALPEDILNTPVQYGGPVEPSRGFVLHTADYFSADASLPVTEHIALTATLDILRSMAKGKGPAKAILALGYSGWAPGQLENEIQRNGWLTCPADDSLLFAAANDDKYTLALRKLGVDPAMLSSDAGHG